MHASINEKGTITGFTFQYGSTQIKLAPALLNVTPSFTFQYGSTQMNSGDWNSGNRNRFTFQYGSTQIRFSKRTLCFSISFTFQYGSTQIKMYLRTIQTAELIYIPIWFYSNHMSPLLLIIFTIYIPIWFYSNELYFVSNSLSPDDLHSNMVLLKCFGFFITDSFKIIYIPIWFYSN